MAKVKEAKPRTEAQVAAAKNQAARRQAKKNQKSAAEERKSREGKQTSASGYVVTADFTQHMPNEQIPYRKGDELPANTHPNLVAKYLSAGLLAAKPEEPKAEEK